MVSLKERSSQQEWMDAPQIPVKLLHKNLGELDLLNRHLGGHAISMAGIRHLIKDRKKLYHIVDLGCGSGDILKCIAKWARTNNYLVKLTGVDKNPDAIQYLKSNCMDFPEISGLVSDYRQYLESGPEIDIVHCSLFCHHLNNEALVELFGYLKAFAKKGFVINDLHRSKVAYYSVWLLTRLLKGSDLSKHDGPVSIMRAFTREELKYLLRQSGIIEVSIKWRWAFRYLVTVPTGHHNGRK